MREKKNAPSRSLAGNFIKILNEWYNGTNRNAIQMLQLKAEIISLTLVLAKTRQKRIEMGKQLKELSL